MVSPRVQSLEEDLLCQINEEGWHFLSPFVALLNPAGFGAMRTSRDEAVCYG